MRALDRFLQTWRIKKACFWVPAGAQVFDIGCHQGEMFESLRGRIGASQGIDPRAIPRQTDYFTLINGNFPESSPAPATFDVITMLATLEHVMEPEKFASSCAQVLRSGGRLIATVPSPVVDLILEALIAVKLIDGMCAEEHHGFEPHHTIPLFEGVGLVLEHHSRFQFGLNHLFVFKKP